MKNAFSKIDFTKPHIYQVSDLQSLLSSLNFNQLILKAQDSYYLCGEDFDKFYDRSLSENISISDIINNTERFKDILSFKDFFSKDSPPYASPLKLPLHLIPEQTREGIWDLRSFIGKAGEKSSLHYDWNATPSLLIHLEGTKKVSFIPPEESYQLNSYHIFSFEYSKLGKMEYILNPGDALVIPPYYWHQITYQTDAHSISLRLNPEPLIEKVMRSFYPTWKIAQIYSINQFQDASFLSLLDSLDNDQTSSLEYEKIEAILNSIIKIPFNLHPKYDFFSKEYYNQLRTYDRNKV